MMFRPEDIANHPPATTTSKFSFNRISRSIRDPTRLGGPPRTRSEILEKSHRITLNGEGQRSVERFTSLNEIVERDYERIQTQSTQWFFSPNDVGQARRAELEAIPESQLPQSTSTSATIVEPNTSRDSSSITRENSIRSATTLVEADREAVADVSTGGSGEDVFEKEVEVDDESDHVDDLNDTELYAISPILGVRRLPSIYDAARQHGSASIHTTLQQSPRSQSSPSESNHSIPLSDRLPVSPKPDQSEQSDLKDVPSQQQPVQPVGSESSSPNPPAEVLPETPVERNTEADGPSSRDTQRGSGTNAQPNEGLVETSVLLTVSIVNRSGENLSNPTNQNDYYSTLEYVEFIETASCREYSFSSELLERPVEGFLRRSASGLRRMLSARNRFIGKRSHSFIRRLQREVDLEMQNPDAAWQEQDAPAELEGTPAGPIGPYELTVSPTHEGWGQWGARPQIFRNGTFTKLQTLSRMCCAIFGRNLPRELRPMCKVYMKQLDEHLELSMKKHELQTPNSLRWPNPLLYLEECLKIVVSRMESSMSIEDFVQRNLAYLMLLMQQGPAGASHMEAVDLQSSSDSQLRDNRSVQLAHEWMLFCLEAWTMLDMTAICKNRHDLRLSENFCNSPLKDTIESLLPRLHARYTQNTSTNPVFSGRTSQIFPHEMTAEMLQDLGGVQFVWTEDITKHLTLDTKRKTVALYSHVAFAYLHAEAGTDSSLSKAGLNIYHHICTEIAESYRLLFGSGDRSRKIFNSIDPNGRSPGYFDVFSLHSHLDCVKPKWLYNASEDFPVFGDRLMELRTLLKPKGLKGLWLDTRDSLQWYTFWAVVIVGGLSLFLGFIQMGLGAVQAYASLASLKSGSYS
ncbi:hypothetical protein BDZ91DRAFT_848580 [Kalaharituber pfeilii]|nr:hypothetical protein BDZ91DRAFT_848580 [Kalaharituber pfeilii]